jgi:hypothetical protein
MLDWIGEKTMIDDIKYILSRFHKSSCYPDAMDGELEFYTELIIRDVKTHPIYLARRHGMGDWFTCDYGRYIDLSTNKLFDVKVVYEIME